MKIFKQLKIPLWIAALLFFAAFLIWVMDQPERIPDKSLAFIESQMTSFTEGDYEEKSVSDFSLMYLTLDKKEKETIINAAKSLVDTKFYELGNTLYQLEINLRGTYIEMKATPLYDEQTIIDEMNIPVDKNASKEQFIENVRRHVKENYEYMSLGFDYEPLGTFVATKKGQCYNFTELFYLIANANDMKVRVEMNKYHAWNLVEIKGEWVKVDLTLDLEEGGNQYE